MICPSCDEKITDGAWMCPFCEHIVDVSFLGNDITNDLHLDPPPPALPPEADPPTDGLDVHEQMIVSSLEDEVPVEAITDDIGPVAREVRSLGLPSIHSDDKIDTKPLPDEMQPTPPLRPLDPSLLQEIKPVQPAPMMISSEPRKKGLPPLKKTETSAEEAKRRETLVRAMSRGPAQERAPPAPPMPPPSPVMPIPKSDTRSRPVEAVVRSAKAEKIFQQALEDMESGALVSARTNIKLALTFDPGNERYAAKLDEIESEVGPSPSQDLEEIPKGTQFATAFYEKAVDQENQGNFDEAIRLLEKAIRADPQGVYYHRLGTILAFRKGLLKEGRTMVDKAIQRSPKNKNYSKTLGRILNKMNGGAPERKNMSNMLGGLLKRK